MRRLFLAIALAGFAQAAPPAQQADPVERVRRFSAAYVDPRIEMQPDALVGLPELIGELRMIQVALPDRRQEVFLALLDLASVSWTRPSNDLSAAFSSRTPREAASALAFDALERALDLDRDGSFSAWVGSAVIAPASVQPMSRRRAALELYAGHRVPTVQLAIMDAALDPRREIRDSAMRALVGWNDDGVHRFMLMQLEKCGKRPDWCSAALIRKHFDKVPLSKGSMASKAVFEYARDDMLSQDWREAVRALRLLSAVDDTLAVPALIEALSVWILRGEEGHGRKRIEDEIHRQLKERSGKSIPALPERWARWWKVASAGAVPQKSPDDQLQETRAAFFGLRPVTDHVTFILDRSGSMATPIRAGGPTRFQEALAQMKRFLADLGPKARFRIVLFESFLHVWKDKLVEVGEFNLESAGYWAGSEFPKGGTVLRTAVEHVLRINRDGEPDIGRIEEDTVIILCDGATTDGPSWVRPLLERVGDQCCVVFHCVQIGGESDGTLQLLAELTGGQFLRVD